jgi:hypothetical protein
VARRAAQYAGSLEAGLLHCPVPPGVPVRKRLLLVLLDGEAQYVCQRCGTPCASKMEPAAHARGPR